MKIKNIVFSGFMAAIVMNAGAASAATTQIASKAYVEKSVETKADTTYVNQQLGTKANRLTEGTVGNITTVAADGSYADGGIKATDLATQSYVEQQITNITGGVDSDLTKKADKLTAEQVGENAGNIATVDANGQYQVSTTKIGDLATQAALTIAAADASSALTNAATAQSAAESAGAAASAAQATADEAKAGLNTKLTIAQGAEAADKIVVTDASGNVTTSATIAATKVSGLGELAMVAPTECSNETALCVLAFNGTDYSWVNVTAPVNEDDTSGR